MQISSITTTQVYRPQGAAVGVENGTEPAAQAEKPATTSD